MRTDSELLIAYAHDGDEEAFREIVSRHGPMICRVCERILRDRHAAEDAAQAVFLVLMQKAGRLRKGNRLAAWLHGVARNIARRAARTRQNQASRERRYMMNSSVSREHALSESEVRELKEDLDAALKCLSAKQREAVILRYLEGCSISEAAVLAGCSETALSTRANDGLIRLRRKLRAGKKIALPALVALMAQETQAAGQAAAAWQAAAVGFAGQGASAATAGATATISTLAKTEITMMMLKNIVAVVAIAATVAAGGGAAVLLAQAPDHGSPSQDQQLRASLVEAEFGSGKLLTVKLKLDGLGDGRVGTYSRLKVDRAIDDQGRKIKYYVRSDRGTNLMFGQGDAMAPLWYSTSLMKPADEGKSVEVELPFKAPAEDAKTFAELSGSVRLRMFDVKETTVKIGAASKGELVVPELADFGIRLIVQGIVPSEDKTGHLSMIIAGDETDTLVGASLENPGGGAAIKTLFHGIAGLPSIRGFGPIGPETVLKLQLGTTPREVDVSFALKDIAIPERPADFAAEAHAPRLMSLTVSAPTNLADRVTVARGIELEQAVDDGGVDLTFRPDGIPVRGWGKEPVTVLARTAPVTRAPDGDALNVQLPFDPPVNRDARTLDLKGKLQVTVAEETKQLAFGNPEALVGQDVNSPELRKLGLSFRVDRIKKADRNIAVYFTASGELSRLVDVRLEWGDGAESNGIVGNRMGAADDPLKGHVSGPLADDLRIVLKVATKVADAEVPFDLKEVKLPASLPRPSASVDTD